MKILHITNDFLGSSVYKELFSALGKLNCKQIVYNAYNFNRVEHIEYKDLIIPNCKIIARNILNIYSRLHFQRKIRLILEDIISEQVHEGVDLIHAHTWFSDGFVAYELYQRYNLPYIITIRSTDMNLFYKCFLHLRKRAINVLLYASKIIVLSPVYKSKLLDILYSKSDLLIQISYKINIIPNGVNQYWLKKNMPKKELTTPIRLIYVGRFNRRKNVLKLMKAVLLLSKEIECTLTLVGGGGNHHNKVLNCIRLHNTIFKYVEFSPKEVLIDLYKESHIFTMPSLSETFGLVYVEALSQGLPILFSRNEGVDGYYNNCGEAADPKSVSSIMECLSRMVENYEKYSINQKLIYENHSWNLIASNLLTKIYKQ